MTATIAAPQGFELYPGSTTAAFVGEDDAVTQRVAGVLNRHRYQVVHHRSPEELIENLGEKRSGAAAVRGRKRRLPVQRSKVGQSERPVLYVFNCRIPGPDNTLPAGADAWLDALKAVSTRAPGTAILVVVGPDQDAGLIKDALQAGADEILSAGDTEIEELVWVRVQSALARAEAGPEGSAVPLADAPSGERRVGERRRGERRGSRTAAAAAAAASQAGDIVETWDEPASADEVHAARDRVRAVLHHLPSARERQGPLADLLGVTVPALRGESGRLDARKIAQQLGVPLARIARLTPISRQALNETPDSARAQAALDPLARVLDVLGVVLQPGQVRAWLNAPHARLGGEPPIRALLDGRAEQVARMLEAARDGGVD